MFSRLTLAQDTPKPAVVRTPVSATLLDDDDPLEVDLSTLAAVPTAQSAPVPPFPGFPGLAGMGAGDDPLAGGPDMFAQMMQQMMAGQGQGPPNASGPMPMFGTTGGPPAPNSPFPPSPPKTLLDRVFPLVHLLAMVALAAYAVVHLEPARKFGLYGWMGVGGSVDWSAWSALARRRPGHGVLDAVGQMSGVGLAEVVRGLLRVQ